MFYVYLLRSINVPAKTYIGITNDLKIRLEVHNSGGSMYTKTYRPSEIIVYLGFKEESSARCFEKYLKSHAGRAFAHKRFW